MSTRTLLWVIFGAVVVLMMVLDLGVFHRRKHEVRFKEAALWTIVWIFLALGFAGLIAYKRGANSSLEFLTGYIIEESLSVDNLFVFLLIFSYFAVPSIYQHSVLFWGIIGAMALRAVFILTGVALIEKFEWVIYVFGAILLVSGVKMALEKEKRLHPESNPVLRLFRKLMPVTKDYQGGKFLVRREGRTFATPLLLVLLVIETTDLIFAVDSIPAVLAITRDRLIVYTSNIFAVLGLRSLYFALKGAMDMFHRLHYGLSVILVFVGAKMILSHYFQIPIGVALSVVAAILIVSIAASLIWPEKKSDQRTSMQSP
ncbi:MAG TPA: TerC family protein [Verrucomicrobiae bacterium]|nr:TerC family protein [Verrucomicrobiae bacterium]